MPTFQSLIILHYVLFFLQHANEDVEKMILGNKCDMEDKRVIPKEKGEAVSLIFFFLFFHSSY